MPGSVRSEISERQTHKECHGQCIKYQYEEELEEVSSVGRKTSHPVDTEMYVSNYASSSVGD